MEVTAKLKINNAEIEDIMKKLDQVSKLLLECSCALVNMEVLEIGDPIPPEEK